MWLFQQDRQWYHMTDGIFALCPMLLFSPFPISYPSHSGIASVFTYMFQWTRIQISWTWKIEPFVFNIFPPLRQDIDTGWKQMLPKGVSSLTLRQSPLPTVFQCFVCLDLLQVLSRDWTCSSITFSEPEKKKQPKKPFWEVPWTFLK